MDTAVLEFQDNIATDQHQQEAVVVFVNNKPFRWVKGLGLEPAAVQEIIHFVKGLVMDYLPRVRSQALTFNDLLQEGLLGALEAARRFDPAKGGFLTYAEWWVRKNMHDMLREDVVSISERSARAGVPFFVRLDQPIVLGRPDVSSIECQYGLKDDAEADQMAEANSTMQVICDAMRLLTPIEQDVIRRRFGMEGCEPEILDTIAQSYGVSRERIRQREITALAALRKAFERRGLRSSHLLSVVHNLDS